MCRADRSLYRRVFQPALKFGQNDIITSPSVWCNAEVVIHLFAAIQRKHTVVHFLIDIINGFIIQEHAVCCNGKTKMLSAFLFTGTCISHSFFHNIHRHQRFSAEKVHFNIAPLSGRAMTKSMAALAVSTSISSRPVPKSPVAAKTIFAAQIAVVRHMETQRFDRRIFNDSHSRVNVICRSK